MDGIARIDSRKRVVFGKRDMGRSFYIFQGFERVHNVPLTCALSIECAHNKKSQKGVDRITPFGLGPVF